MGRTTAEDYEAWVDWVAEHDWNVFGTLNFVSGHKVTGDEAKRLWCRFWNKADRLLYGTSCSYGYRIDRAVFTQYGALGDNAHIHFLARSPIEPVQFCTGLNALWRTTTDCAAHPKNNEILPIFSKRDATEYALHDFWLSGSETFNHTLSHLNPENTQAHVQAANRLNQAANGIWLARARLAFDDHMAAAQARYERRNS